MRNMAMLVVCAFAVTVGAMFATGKEISSEDDKYQVEIFGTKESPPISTGFFFYEGGYVPPPYVVKRFGNSVMINGIVIYGPMTYVPPEKRPQVPEKMPEVPKGVTKETDIDSDVVVKYRSRVRSYVLKRLKNKTAMERAKIIAEAYRKLPCVKKVVVEDDNNLEMELYDGTSLGVRLRLPARTLEALKRVNELEFTKERLAKRYGEVVEELKANGVLMGLRSFIPVEETRLCPADLREFVSVINSDKPSVEKEAFLKRMFPHEEEVLGLLLKNYKPSEELADRVGKLYEKWKKERPDEYREYELAKLRKPLEDLLTKKYEEFVAKGEEYWKQHEDEREKAVAEMKRLQSEIRKIKNPQGGRDIGN